MYYFVFLAKLWVVKLMTKIKLLQTFLKMVFGQKIVKMVGIYFHIGNAHDRQIAFCLPADITPEIFCVIIGKNLIN